MAPNRVFNKLTVTILLSLFLTMAVSTYLTPQSTLSADSDEIFTIGEAFNLEDTYPHINSIIIASSILGEYQRITCTVNPGSKVRWMNAASTPQPVFLTPNIGDKILPEEQNNKLFFMWNNNADLQHPASLSMYTVGVVLQPGIIPSEIAPNEIKVQCLAETGDFSKKLQSNIISLPSPQIYHTNGIHMINMIPSVTANEDGSFNVSFSGSFNMRVANVNFALFSMSANDQFRWKTGTTPQLTIGEKIYNARIISSELEFKDVDNIDLDINTPFTITGAVLIPPTVSKSSTASVTVRLPDLNFAQTWRLPLIVPHNTASLFKFSDYSSSPAAEIAFRLSGHLDITPFASLQRFNSLKFTIGSTNPEQTTLNLKWALVSPHNPDAIPYIAFDGEFFPGVFNTDFTEILFDNLKENITRQVGAIAFYFPNFAMTMADPHGPVTTDVIVTISIPSYDWSEIFNVPNHSAPQRGGDFIYKPLIITSHVDSDLNINIVPLWLFLTHVTIRIRIKAESGKTSRWGTDPSTQPTDQTVLPPILVGAGSDFIGTYDDTKFEIEFKNVPVSNNAYLCNYDLKNFRLILQLDQQKEFGVRQFEYELVELQTLFPTSTDFIRGFESKTFVDIAITGSLQPEGWAKTNIVGFNMGLLDENTFSLMVKSNCHKFILHDPNFEFDAITPPADIKPIAIINGVRNDVPKCELILSTKTITCSNPFPKSTVGRVDSISFDNLMVINDFNGKAECTSPDQQLVNIEASFASGPYSPRVGNSIAEFPLPTISSDFETIDWAAKIVPNIDTVDFTIGENMGYIGFSTKILGTSKAIHATMISFRLSNIVEQYNFLIHDPKTDGKSDLTPSDQLTPIMIINDVKINGVLDAAKTIITFDNITLKNDNVLLSFDNVYVINKAKNIANHEIVSPLNRLNFGSTIVSDDEKPIIAFNIPSWKINGERTLAVIPTKSNDFKPANDDDHGDDSDDDGSKKPTRTGKIILIICIVLLTIALVGFLIYRFAIPALKNRTQHHSEREFQQLIDQDSKYTTN